MPLEANHTRQGTIWSAMPSCQAYATFISAGGHQQVPAAVCFHGKGDWRTARPGQAPALHLAAGAVVDKCSSC